MACELFKMGTGDAFGNSALIVQITLSDSFQAVPNSYLDNLSNMNDWSAVPECSLSFFLQV